MGISKGGARFLLEEARNFPFSGRVLQLGRQHLFFKQSDFDRLASLHSVNLNRSVPPENILRPMLDPSFLDDGSFFSELGFADIESMDYSDFEGATYVQDLNNPVPSALHGRFDTIYDGGTIEHIFDLRAVFHNIFDMMKVGGRIIHASPSSNHVDHGFYMFSPTLFYDYYMANRFIIHECQIFLYSKDYNNQPWKVFDYEPGCLEKLSFGGFNTGHLVGLYISAEKTAESTWDKIPQQAMYVKKWGDETNASDTRHRRPRSAPPHASVSDLLSRIFRRRKRIKIPHKVADY